MVKRLKALKVEDAIAAVPQRQYVAIMNDEASTDTDCYCGSLPDLAVVPMGSDGLDERVFASFERLVEHGGDQWWLYVSNCHRCSQDWMIASDERIYDNHYLRRITPSVRQAAVENGRWPDEFMTYEQVLRIGRTMSTPWTFLDRRSPGLVWTAEDLRREKPDISFAEIAYLLGIPEPDAVRLLQKPTFMDRFRAWLSRH
ncbi:hypothetical protein [Sphingobium sp.]|uniref:hypothetical protein n=2 Tax=unclassified Sphingobium TaxID=2611147 RepID=UPI002D810D78|nr:hypothetical protein [Sphingobium sp.]